MPGGRLGPAVLMFPQGAVPGQQGIRCMSHVAPTIAA